MKPWAFLVVAFLAVGCSSDRMIRVTSDNKDSVLDQIKTSRAFTVEEAGLLNARRIRVGIAVALHQPPPAWEGKTLQEIIDEERQFSANEEIKKKETDRLAAEAKHKEEAAAAELRNTLTVAVFKKGFVPSNYQEDRYEDKLTIACVYENKSPKDIRAFTGRVRFADLFDKEVYVSSLTISDPVKAGSKATWNGEIKYNKFMADHQWLRITELQDMKITWLPASIIFVDGTKLGGS